MTAHAKKPNEPVDMNLSAPVPKKILLLGAGHSRKKKFADAGEPLDWGGQVVALDMNPACGADVVWDIEKRPLPFPDAEFDEIHAYDSLEHWGRQGDWRGWFDEMAEYHRLLKPGGRFTAAVPVGADALADPGHTRFFGTNHFMFLDQRWCEEQLAAGKPVTDYRWYWTRDFSARVYSVENHHLLALLEKR